jgi:heme-degrading monooxygenase HmoA
MHARVTQFDIDTLVISMDRALARFKELVLPVLRQQPGFEGLVVLQNEEGRGILVSFWDSEEAASAGLASGYYDEQVSKFVTLYRQPPGREHFAVTVLEGAPAAALGR